MDLWKSSTFQVQQTIAVFPLALLSVSSSKCCGNIKTATWNPGTHEISYPAASVMSKWIWSTKQLHHWGIVIIDLPCSFLEKPCSQSFVRLTSAHSILTDLPLVRQLKRIIVYWLLSQLTEIATHTMFRKTRNDNREKFKYEIFIKNLESSNPS